MNKSTLLEQVNNVAKILGIKPSKILLGQMKQPNIIFVNNNSTQENLSKEISDKNIIIELKIESWALRTIIRVPDNYISEEPWYFCFKLDDNTVKQAVSPTWYIWKNSKVKIYAYCFWLEEGVTHADWKKYHIDEGGSLEIYEFNFNSDNSYMTVYNSFKAYVWKNWYFKNHYESTMWYLGHWITRWEVFLEWENSKAEFITKNKILKWDISDLDIKFHLKWKKSSALMLSKSITFEWWKNLFQWTLIWEGDNSSGHIDCSEISMWKCEIETIPKLKVLNSSSRLTHEASVWTLERKSIENLMIKWFTEEESIKFLITWILN